MAASPNWAPLSGASQVDCKLDSDIVYESNNSPLSPIVKNRNSTTSASSIFLTGPSAKRSPGTDCSDPIDVKPQLLSWEDTQLTLAQLNDLSTAELTNDDDIKTLPLALRSIAMSALNTPEIPKESTPWTFPSMTAASPSARSVFDPLVDTLPASPDLWPRLDFVTHEQVSTTAVDEIVSEETTTTEHNVNDAVLFEQIIGDIRDSIADTSPPSAHDYTVVAMQPMAPQTTQAATIGGRTISHDHDYCQQEDSKVLGEFLNLTESFELPTDANDAFMAASEFLSVETIDAHTAARTARTTATAGDTSSVGSTSGLSKTDRRRILNNLACIRARRKRKLTRLELADKLNSVVERNTSLKDEVANLEAMRDEWKARLLEMAS